MKKIFNVIDNFFGILLIILCVVFGIFIFLIDFLLTIIKKMGLKMRKVIEKIRCKNGIFANWFQELIFIFVVVWVLILAVAFIIYELIKIIK
jgi:hypothetical protein